jgi:glucose/arabinose dehydrogenase
VKRFKLKHHRPRNSRYLLARRLHKEIPMPQNKCIWPAFTIGLATIVSGCGSTPAVNHDASSFDAAIDVVDARMDASVDAPVDAAAQLEITSSLPPDDVCEFGVRQTDRGVDDGRGGAIAGDGVLSPTEVVQTSRDCLTAPDPALIADSGLMAAPANTTCAPPSGDSSSSGIRTARAFGNVPFPINPDCRAGINAVDCTTAFRPIAMRQHPVSGQRYVVEQNGRIVRIDGATAQVALDLRAKVVFGFEPGLLSLDFDPRNPNQAYVSYITCDSQQNGLRASTAVDCPDGSSPTTYAAISRFTLSSTGNLDPASERLILEQEKPTGEHNGGGVMFGPDGNLFIAMGDGGDYPTDEAQLTDRWPGKILRVNVNDSNGTPLPLSGPGYTIPSNNPFKDQPGYREEIYALGFRNPWRFGFDPSNTILPRLWVGDVGLITAEEINYVEAGKNYGWPIMEGNFCHFRGADVGRFTVSADTTCNLSGALTPPAHTYLQSHGVSVTGGFVYRGQALASLRGAYLYADFSLGHIWSLRNGAGVAKPQFVEATGMLLSSFAQDTDGELYVMDWWTGEIRKLVPTATSPARPAAMLSGTGCVNPTTPVQPAPGALPYSVNVPFFSEPGVHKQRHLFLPIGGGRLTEYDQTGTLIVQPGTVLMKDFSISGKRIETRLMFFQNDAKWTSWTYKWRADQSNADLADQSEDLAIGAVKWHLPNQGECVHCHTAPTGGLLGFRVEQINRLGFYPSTGKWANQVDTLRTLGLIDRVEPIDATQPISATNARIVAMPSGASIAHLPRLDDSSVPIVDRVGAYLEVNCSNCHRPAGGGRGEFNLQRDHFVKDLCNVTPQVFVFDDPSMRLIKPNDPQRSMVLRRLQENGVPYRMHPYRSDVDTVGIELLTEWINTTAAADCAAQQ